MKYTEEEMILHSDSGYCMPFEAPQGEDVELSLGYGEQTHPETGEQFFHHGIDFPVRYRMLAAVADGIVSGVGSDPVHGICQTIRYGEYEVTYGHLSNVYAQFGQRVKAGQTVALSGERLHVGVRFKGEELNPIEFLTMLYGNIRALQEAGGEAAGGFCEPAPAPDYEPAGDRGADAPLPALLHGGLAAEDVHGARAYGAVAAPHLHYGRNEGVFLRADAEHVQPSGAGTQSPAAGGQGAEPADRGLPELPRPAPRGVPPGNGRRRKKKNFVPKP